MSRIESDNNFIVLNYISQKGEKITVTLSNLLLLTNADL